MSGIIRKDLFIALLTITVFASALTACGKSKTPADSKARVPRAVVLVPVERGNLPRTVTVTGTLAADEEVVASFKVAGRISELMVDLGSTVRKNQIIARLDPTDFLLKIEQAEAALRQTRARLGLSPEGKDDLVDPDKTAPVREARAVLEEARLNRERAASLHEKNYISKMDLDSAVSRQLVAESRYQASIEEVRDRQALLAQRKSELALARQQLADATLHSPIDGAVRERKTSVGEFLPAGSPIAVLVRNHPLRLRASVPERDAAGIRAGQVTHVRVEGDQTEHTGRVVRLSPVFEKQNRTLTIEAEVENTEGRLRAGSFATAEILIEAQQPVVFAPVSAIINFAGIEKVILEKQGVAVERRIRTGRRAGDRVEVLEGLAPGDLIVAEPGNLGDGEPVSVKQ
ncbi:MAG: efflux RND transporter periplasmic adaptor subunit [Nitrospirae bacterium]|nr:efflux RND transporter periplasmic adaptor subunit [Nitrospirota bacterium]